ncbi:hypothetical protein V8E51_013505 [Hyaloscypha variabilis]
MSTASTSQGEGAEAPKEEPEPRKKHQSGLDPFANTIKAHSIMLRNLRESRFFSLPVDILYMLFKYLDRCTSTCLGLTAKALCLIHFHLRGKVPLNAFCILTPASTNNASQLLGNDQPSLSSLSSSSSNVPRDATRTVGVLKMVNVAQSSRAFEEWRQRGISNVWSKVVEEQLDARSKGTEIAKNELGGYEENGIWFYA